MKDTEETAAPSPATACLRVRLLTEPEDIERLGPAWLTLESRPTDHEAVFFQSFDWCRYVIAIRRAHDADRFKPLVAVVENGAEVVAIWPLSLQRHAGLWTAHNLDTPFGQFAGILCAHAVWIETCVKAILVKLDSSRRADALCIDGVIEGSPLHCALLSVGARTGGSNQIVQVDMRGAATFADYQRTLNPKSRKNLRNAMNRLRTAHGEVGEAIIDAPDELAPIVRDTYEGRVEWMRTHGKSTNAFRDATFRPLVDGLCRAPNLRLLGFQMQAFGTVIASQWGFVHADRYYAYMSARETGYDEFSPGRLHLGSVIAGCKARGIAVLELMAPAVRYKLMWSDRVVGIHDMWIPLSLRGRVAMAAHDAIVPRLHSLARALPKSLKTRLARRVNSE